MRLKIIRIVIYCLLSMLVLELFYVQVVRGRHYYEQSMNNRIRVVPLEGWRGKIIDRNGTVLADNKRSFQVMVTPQEIEDIEGLFAFLAKVLGEKKEALLKEYYRKKFTPFAPVVIADNIDEEMAVQIEENKFRFPSLVVSESFKRYYPFHRAGAHVLGYVSKITQDRAQKFKEYGYTPPSNVGYSGVEEFYDEHLKGNNGGIQVEVNSRGQQVRLLSLKEPAKGMDIQLTVDAEIQQIAQDTLGERAGTIILMDLQSGEILGLVSSPTYDPNFFIEKKYTEQLRGILNHPRSPLLNRAIKGQYPPGSVFKIVMALGALDSGKITQYTTFNCPGYFVYGGVTFGDTCRYGDQNLLESIAHSCNVYFYHTGLLMGADLIHKYAKMFFLGEKTHVDLPYEEDGFIPSRKTYLTQRKKWYPGNTINMSIGQGDVLTTPLQMVRMMAAVANDGKLVQPHLIKMIGDQPVIKYDHFQEVKIDPQIFEIVKKGMRSAVADPSGTAHTLDMPEVYVAGKTGTAQSAPNKDHHAWFVGYARGEMRSFAFAVFLEYGGSSHNATELGREMLGKMAEGKLL